MKPLKHFARSVHSQLGEDGIIEELLRRLGSIASDAEKWCVELGAWDGMYLSNTCNLIENHGFRAVLIEGDAERYSELCANMPSDDVVKLNRMVTLEGDSTLDAILGNTPIPAEFELLSIDVDSCDYHVWQSVTAYRPKIVVIEYNPTIPVDVPYIQPADYTVNHGNGVKALDNLAREKGYTTVALTRCNLIAVRDDLVAQVTHKPPPPVERMAARTGNPRIFLFVAFDGTVMSNAEDLPFYWHRTQVTPDDIQALPRYLRTYPQSYSRPQRMAFRLYDRWRRFRRALRGDAKR